MEWFCTMLMTGVLLSIGWRLGGVIFEYIRSIMTDAPDGMRKIRRYQKRKQNRQLRLTYDIEQRRP